MNIIFGAILLLFSIATFAVENKSISDSSNTITIRFDDAPVANSQDKNSSTPKPKRIFPKDNIKLGLLGPVNGEVLISYERYIADFFTMQVGVGITTRDFIGDYYSRLSFGSKAKYKSVNSSWTGQNETDEYDDNTTYEFRKAGIGYAFAFAPRFFPGGDAFDGFYISPYLAYHYRTYKAQKVDQYGTRTSEYQKENAKKLSVCLNFGWQKNFEPVILDFYFSLGVTRSKQTRLDVGATLDELQGIYIYGNRTATFNRLNPYFKLGLDLGMTLGGKKKKNNK